MVSDINDVNAENDIVVSFDALEMNEERAAFIQRLSDILTDSGSIGYMKYDIFDLKIKKIKNIVSNNMENKNGSRRY